MSKTKQKSVQDIKDEIFRRMSDSDKISMVSDFSRLCLDHGAPDGIDIPSIYLVAWLRKNIKDRKRRFDIKTDTDFKIFPQR